MPKLPTPQCLLWAYSQPRALSRPQPPHQHQQRRSAFMPVLRPPPPQPQPQSQPQSQPRTIRVDLNHQDPQIKTGLYALDTPKLEEPELVVCTAAATASPTSPSSLPSEDPNDLPVGLEDKFVSLEYALAVLRSLMTLAEKDRDDHGFSLGPLSNKGTVEMQKNSDDLDCIDMASMIVRRAKSTWNPTEAGDIREMLMAEKRRKGRMGRSNSSDRLLEELLVHDITRRITPFYKRGAMKGLVMNLDDQFLNFMMVKGAIWPAYEAARERQGFKNSKDLTMDEKSMVDFYI
ncbi:hypothetical protein QBC36DRAFT_304080 [Triangularia setosa]|uniref:Uncharacterized protein n=1 Tax=Triangularia setosa TaxID=2587417 RepID=A0AAN7A3Q1_9PEZI|nr:hypothetical protein QBC36DRAFT_304080 [Podospora setosa]